MQSLPLVRHSERVAFKRCEKRWYWAWRRGLVPKTQLPGALELGTWTHEALAAWYTLKDRRKRSLAELFTGVADTALATYTDLPDHVLAKAEELRMLGLAITTAYDKKYGADESVRAIAAELPLEYPIKNKADDVVALHKLKPDLIYEDANRDVWMMEHKTAKQIRTGHLVLDDQARPYAAMAELTLREKGLLTEDQQFKGVMYNFIKKILPDERSTDEKGRALNKNGTLSKRQPLPSFLRYPVTLGRRAKRIALTRLRFETILITSYAQAIREKRIDPNYIRITPHSSCEKLCPFFTMCVVAEQGGNVAEMERSLFTRRNPYTYDEETADIPTSFELS